MNEDEQAGGIRVRSWRSIVAQREVRGVWSRRVAVAVAAKRGRSRGRGLGMVVSLVLMEVMEVFVSSWDRGCVIAMIAVLAAGE
jgi:hypothetical protein